MRLIDQCRTILRMERGEIPLDSRLVPDPPSEPEKPFTPHEVSEEGIALIKRFEGLARVRPDGMIEAYPDPATGGDPWTIGYGTTRIGGVPVEPGLIITLEEAEELLAEDLEEFTKGVRTALGSAIHATSQPQFDALVSFTYNVGRANLLASTLLGKHKARDYKGAAREFMRWVYAGKPKRKVSGLVRRRKAERDLYLRGTK